MKSVAEQYAGWCKHFNGIMNDSCKLGIRYDSLVPAEFGRARKLPCLRDNREPVPCDKCVYPTAEEAAEYERESNLRVAEYLNELRQGKCPICKTQVEKQQVGHCVYGSCGHRLYQGRK